MRNCFRKKKYEEDNGIPSNVEMNDIVKTEKIDWRYGGSTPTDNCGICNSSEVSLELSCGHRYHKKCMRQYMTSKKQCMVCNSTDFDNVKMYCDQCMKSYYETNLTAIGYEKQICDGCH